MWIVTNLRIMVWIVDYWGLRLPSSSNALPPSALARPACASIAAYALSTLQKLISLASTSIFAASFALNVKPLVQCVQRSNQPPLFSAAERKFWRLHLRGTNDLHGMHACLLSCYHYLYVCIFSACDTLSRTRLFHLASLRFTAACGFCAGRGLAQKNKCGRSWDTSAGSCAPAALLAVLPGARGC